MSVTNNGDGTWRVRYPMVYTLEMLENLAQGIDDGDVTGNTRLFLSYADYAAIPDALRQRLGAFVVPDGR